MLYTRLASDVKNVKKPHSVKVPGSMFSMTYRYAILTNPPSRLHRYDV